MFLAYLYVITDNGVISVIGICLNPKRLSATVQKALIRSGVAFGFGCMWRQLPTRSLVDAMTNDGAVDFCDFYRALVVGTGD